MSVEAEVKDHRIARRGAVVAGLGFWLTGGALVMALVLGLAMPAKADKKDDLIKGLAAALVVGVIISELDHSPDAKPVKQPKVPAVCAITIHGDERSVTLYPERCLRREGFDYRLPRSCANSATIYGREDRVYSASCLRSAGFRIERH